MKRLLALVMSLMLLAGVFAGCGGGGDNGGEVTLKWAMGFSEQADYPEVLTEVNKELEKLLPNTKLEFILDSQIASKWSLWMAGGTAIDLAHSGYAVDLYSEISEIIEELRSEKNVIFKQKKVLIEREINRNLLKKALKLPYDNFSDIEKKQFAELNNNFSGFVLEVKMQSNLEKWEEIRHHFFGELLTDNPDVYFIDGFSNVIILIGLFHKAQDLSKELIDEYVNKLSEEMAKNGIFIKYDIKTYSSLKDIFGSATDEKDVNKKRLDNILKYIEDNFNLDISLEIISGKFYMSKEYFSRFFKRHMGTSFVQYLAEYRIEKAKELIIQGYALNHIAEKVGYKNYKNFSKRFKDIVRITPKEYRQQRR